MNTPTDTQSAFTKFLYRPRKSGWMRARIAFNIYRAVLGVVVLATLPWVGPLALLGALPLTWAAVSSLWIYHVQHNPQSNPAYTAR
jgi:hypothetical protein